MGYYMISDSYGQPWTSDEQKTLQSLWIGGLADLPIDESNAVADDANAAKLGHKLFFDTRLSINGLISCATCHQPERRFTDGLSKGFAIGESDRNTPSVVGLAYSPWFFWDGRRDSLWAQALTPLEDRLEHGGNRMAYVRLMTTDGQYRELYENLFGELPDVSDLNRFPLNAAPIDNSAWNKAWQLMTEDDQHRVNRVFSNMGKSIAAYERLLVPQASRFDAYVEAVLNDDHNNQHQLFNDNEIHGLRLFIGKAGCTNCHNGPLLTNNEFHNTGLINFDGEIPDKGRVEGARAVHDDPFNCTGIFSDQLADDCTELRFMRAGPELIGAMRTPSLRNLEGTGPFMHKGQLKNLGEVLDHYNQAADAMIGHNEAKPLRLNQLELLQLEKFLITLNAPVHASRDWLSAPNPGR